MQQFYPLKGLEWLSRNMGDRIREIQLILFIEIQLNPKPTTHSKGWSGCQDTLSTTISDS